MELPLTETTLFNTEFCLLMTSQVLLKQIEVGSNFVSSPLSFHVLLSLIASGSTGRTLEQLLFFLGSKSIDELNYLSSQISNLTSVIEGGKIEQFLWFQGLKIILF